MIFQSQVELELHGVYSVEEVALALDAYDPLRSTQFSTLFTTRNRIRLMVLHTEKAELVFKILGGDRLELVERSLQNGQ